MTDAEGTSASSQTFNLSCAIAYDPCASITNISACGVSVTSNHAVGIGAYNPPNTSCGFATLGQENIYSFTPATTGTYNLQVTAASGGFVDYFYKDASGGCSGTGWTCIDDINSTGTYGSLPLIGGTQYYFMTDPEGTSAASQTFNFICIQVVANDFCVGAIPVTCGSTISGTTVNATSTGENISCIGYSVGSYGVWYVLPGNGELVTVTTCDINATADLKIHVYSGSCGNLTCVGANDDDGIAWSGLQPTVSFLSVIGVNYYIMVGHFLTPLNGSPFTLSLSCVPYAPCINTSNLTCGVSQTTLFATGIGLLDPVSTSCGFADVGLEKIYSFTPTVSGFHQISQTNFGSISYYFKETANGCSASGWTCIDHLNGAALTNTSAFNLVAGTPYYIMLKNGNAAGQYLTFSLVCPAGSAPANDLCSGAIPVVCGTSIAGTTVNATSVNETALSPCGVSITQPGVWYVFAGNGQQVTASTCSGLSGDTKISVFNGSCLSLTCEGGNDDASPVCGSNSGASSYSFLTNTGVNYYILVQGYSGTLPFELNVSCGNSCSTPANDNCSGAQTLTIESGASCSSPITGDNSCNTAALFNPTCDAGSVINDNWYTFTTSNCTSNLTINLAAVTAVDLRAVVYTGTCAGLTEVSCNNSISGPLTLTGITANTTYYLQVYTTITTPGTFTVCINQTDVTPPVFTFTPATINILTDPGQCTSSATIGSATAIDICTGTVTPVSSPAGPYSVGTHTITWIASDAFGNSATSTQIVNVIDNQSPPTISANGPTLFCFGSSITLSTGVFASYQWSTGATTQSIVVSAENTYYVTVTYGFGCTSSASINLTALPQTPAIMLTGVVNVVQCKGNNTGSIALNATGGTGGFTYAWSNGKTISNVYNLYAGTYTVTVSDNCKSSTKSFTVTEPVSGLLLTSTSTKPKCFGGASGTAMSAVSGGSGVYTYLWSNGQTTAKATGLAAGIYTITVNDGACYRTAIFTLLNPPALIASVGIVSSPTSLNPNGGSLTAVAAGGTPNYVYLWNTNPGKTTASITGLSQGTYSVKVTDKNGCTATKTLVLNNGAKLSTDQTAASQMNINVMPNPGDGLFDIKVASFENGDATIRLVDGIGRVLIAKKMSVLIGDNQTEIDARGFPKGIYMMLFEYNGDLKTVRVIIR